jgi:hypothetical protein
VTLFRYFHEQSRIAGQIEKNVTHNEALALVDFLVGAAVDGVLVDTPPASPGVGDCYILGPAPTGAWAGQAQSIAGYTAGGWRFVGSVDGLQAMDKASGQVVTFAGGAWEIGHVRASKLSVGGDQVVGARQAAIADPTGGTTVDVEARAVIGEILAAVRAHGLIAI